MKKIIAIPLTLIVAASATLFFLRTPDTAPDTMIATYTNAKSKFAEGPDGLRVHYRDQGNPAGIPIVLIHGTASSLHTWEPLVELLGDEYRIITYTQPGHGLTGPNAEHDYSATGMAKALDLVTDELGLSQFVLGGNSMGGWITWRYALANPGKVDALILLDSSGMPLRDGETEPPLNLGFRLLKNPFGRFLVQNYVPRAAVKRSALQSVSVKSVMTKGVVDRYWELLRYPGNRLAAAERALVDREMHYADRIGEITEPALVIFGAEDQLIYATAAKTFGERMQKATVIIYDGVGHLPMEEAPERVAADIDAFLDRELAK